jgi:hypothetical protein
MKMSQFARKRAGCQMSSSARLLVVAGASLGVFAAAVLATPPVFDRVPDNAMIVVAIPSPETFGKNLQALGTATEMPATPDIKDIITGMGFGNSIDLTKAAAIVVLAPELGADGKPKDGQTLEESMDKRAVLLVPVSNYSEFITGLGGTAGEGVIEVTTPSGEPGFAKDIGKGYAALGPDKKLIETFSGASGPQAVKDRLGKAAEKLSDSADMLTFVNAEAIGPMLPSIMAEMKAEAEANMAMGMSDPEAAKKQLEYVQWIVETAVNDSTGLLGTMNFSGQGMAMELTANFKPDSMMAKAFAAGGKASSLWTKLPAQPYLVAGAIDASSGPLKALLRTIVERAPQQGPGSLEQNKTAMLAQIDKSDGVAGVMGFPQGGIMAGIMTSTVSYTRSSDPAGLSTLYKKTMMDVNGTVQNGTKITASIKEGGVKIGDTSVDSWDMQMAPAKDATGEEAEAAAMLPQAFQMMFGNTTGPAGLLAQTSGGMIQTFSKSNTDLMSKALDAANGKGEVFGSDKLIGQVSEKLPTGRIAEAFIGTKTVLDLVTPFVGMAGITLPPDAIPSNLPPIGMAIASDQGSARMTMFIPAPVIKTGVGLGQAFQEQMGGMGGGDGGMNEGDGEGGGGGGGQPRF